MCMLIKKIEHYAKYYYVLLTTMDFNKTELDIINYWETSQLHTKLEDSRKQCPKWEFLDGPPFVNGTPHHGHLLVSSIKDTMARYMSQKGYNISYQIGFDCHGLPLEQEAEKSVGKISPGDSVEKLGIFNDKCREIISSCSDVWYEVLGRLGRQFNKSETYYTADFKFMESLWWAFKKLWDEGLIYRSKKVMPYSPQCETPLSNFEAGSNYQERTDVSVYVKFKLEDSDASLLIWTTTPWSLFANQGICVNPELTYSLVCTTIGGVKDNLWVCSDIIESFFVGERAEYTICQTVKGSELVGLVYKPIFTLDNYSDYRVYGDSYVTNKSGTGLVHLAPLFGEDDMKVMKANGYVDTMLPEYLIDTQCRFTFTHDKINCMGKFVIDTSTDIVVYLKTHAHAIKSEKIKHQYPHCWRTDCPLIYLATDAWFLNVQQIIPELIANNKKIQWSPEYVGTERFANWIANSPDWCLSRNRVWGTPIPVWTNEHGETMCIGSSQELEKLTGHKYTDLHLDKIGNIEFTNESGTWKRTFGILDCWFESGMAGLSRFGFPECSTKSYPVDFIAESLDQTRGWFYTLNVLSTALNHSPAYKQVIVSGLILAEDGKKMSKRLGNYTNPIELIKTYGVDVLRLYLIGSPAAKAEPFCFRDNDLGEITRKILPYYHAHSMLYECATYANSMFGSIDWIGVTKSSNPLDLWIQNKYIEFAKSIYTHMEKLEMVQVPNLIYRFIDNLCNGFVKLSRDRMKGLSSETDSIASISTLYSILSQCNILLAPFIPHLSESFSMLIYNLGNNNTQYSSVHLQTVDINSILNTKLDDHVLNGFYSIIELIESVRNLRQQANKPIYYPLNFIELYTDSETVKDYSNVICRELNIKSLNVYSTSSLEKKYKANKGILGKVFKKDALTYVNKIESGDITWSGCSDDYYTFEYIAPQKPSMLDSKFTYLNKDGKQFQSVVYLDIATSVTSDVEAEINNIRRQINSLRKNMGLKMFNKVEVVFESNDYWNSLDSESLDLLTTRLIATIRFTDKINNGNQIETFNGKKLNVTINSI